MGAYNWINFEAECPNCNQVASIRCQTHIASSFGGDETGRFSNRDYRLGEKMVWWTESDGRFDSWREDGEPDQPLGQAVEACYSNCRRCEAELCAVIQFENLVPTRVLYLELETEWPEGYWR